MLFVKEGLVPEEENLWVDAVDWEASVAKGVKLRTAPAREV